MIRVGISTRHGMADEISRNAPEGIEFTFPTPNRWKHWIFRSPIKSFLMTFEQADDYDVLEAVLSPVITPHPWICSLDCFQAGLAFSLGRIPLPRALRVKYLERLFRPDNFRKLIFWSDAARQTLSGYGGVDSPWLFDKTTVVYPAIRVIPDDQIRYSCDRINILFSGDFFRKGGANVVDAFEQLQRRFEGIRLRLCCDERVDFNTPNTALKEEYLFRIRQNPQIDFGRVSRDVMVNEVLPETDIYLLPSYNEAFGFAILEAMAFGIPVIASRHFAIPEIVEHGQSGLLIDFGRFRPEKLFRGYVVNQLPPEFHRLVTDQLTEYLEALIESPSLRQRLGQAGLAMARSKFSFAERNATMSQIYQQAIC